MTDNRLPGLVDPRVESAAKIWLAGGINPTVCPAAYISKGVKSFSESKINLASPGTYDLTNGINAPTWDTSIGWYFNTTSCYLQSSLPVNLKPATYIVRLKVDSLSSTHNLIGASGESSMSLQVNVTTGYLELDRLNAELIARSTTGISAATDCVVAVSYSADGVYAFYINGTLINTGTNDKSFTLRTLWIGTQFAGNQTYGHIMGSFFYNTALTSEQVTAVSAAMAKL